MKKIDVKGWGHPEWRAFEMDLYHVNGNGVHSGNRETGGTHYKEAPKVSAVERKYKPEEPREFDPFSVAFP